jgi:hypothetical protein
VDARAVASPHPPAVISHPIISHLVVSDSVVSPPVDHRPVIAITRTSTITKPAAIHAKMLESQSMA